MEMTDLSTINLPPHNIEAEEAVLGSLLIDPEAITRVVPILSPDDFYVRKNGWIYDAILALHNRRDPIDYVTLCTELENRHQIDEIGASYIAQLINSVPSAINVAAYAEHVQTSAARRRMLGVASLVAQLAYATDQPLEDALAQVEGAILDLRGQIDHHDRLRPLQAIVNELYDVIATYHATERPPGIPTGIKELDALLGGGLQPATLNLVAARPGDGKSAKAARTALHAAQNGKRVALFSLEMDALEVVSRLVQIEVGLDLKRRLNDEGWRQFTDVSGRLADLPIYIDDTPDIRISDLRAKCIRLSVEQGLDLVLLDYVQLARATQRQGSRYLEVGAVSRGLKHLAQELRIPIVAAAQLGRGADGRRPTLADLRESGNLEADADTVLLLHRPDDNADQEAPTVRTEFILAKNRQGPTGHFHMVFHKPQLRFYPIAAESAS
jgi:replicative DNA helicase